MTSNPIKRHGGKSYLADWIISHMPPHTLYREPFFGGGAVLFRKSCDGIGEAVNDLDGELINFWRVLQSKLDFEDLRRIMEAVPLSNIEWEQAVKNIETLTKMWPDSRIPGGIERKKRAAWFFIRYRQSRQGLGKDYATPTSRTRRGMNEHASAWLSAIEGLPEAHERLIRVEVCCMDAKAFIRKYDAPDALFYCDPPYLHETREVNSTDSYECEMSADDHNALLECLAGIKGKFLLSGYPSDLYEAWRAESGYRVVAKEIDNKASGAKTKAKKTECLWMNY